MFEKTNQSYGVNEVLLASVLGAVVFAVFAAQPLVIVGVTGGFAFRVWWLGVMMLTVYARSDYGLQLHCLRYRVAAWDALPRVHVLDWDVRFWLR
jgi:hypothetical protein